MVHSDKVKDKVERSERASKWPARFVKLKNKKKNPLYKYEFCEKYDICKYGLARHCKGQITPEWAAINKVESALLKEGV